MITVNKVMRQKPCDRYTKEEIRELVGDGISAHGVLKLEIPFDDKCWAMAYLVKKNKVDKLSFKFFGYKTSCIFKKRNCRCCFLDKLFDFGRLSYLKTIAEIIDNDNC